MVLYILERPSSCSTSWIRSSWLQFKVELRLLLLCIMSTLLVCLGPPSVWLSPQWLKFHAYPSRPAGQFNTKVQVNNTAVPHLTHTYTHVHITLVLLSVSFFTLLPPPLSGRLAQTLPVWHNRHIYLNKWSTLFSTGPVTETKWNRTCD